MVLAQLGERISGALNHISSATFIDKKLLVECLDEIADALSQADVNTNLIKDLKRNIKKKVDFGNLCPGHDKRKIIQQTVFLELCNMLDAGKPFFTPKKGKANIVMFVGLQGCGKTTSCTKYAHYYHKKGWKPAVVCADTFRAGAFDQLKQNATKANIPFYGSYMESDPVKIALEGVERFKKESHDLIIIDTSGRHRQEAALFEEMRQLVEATKPDLVIFVMDGSIGQAAFDQAQAFKQSVAVGAVIITKLDGHARGGGALSAVAATKSPVIFIGTGEHMNKFELFEAKSFVNRLLGKGDLPRLMNNLQEVIPKHQQSQLLKNFSEGKFTLRIMRDQFQNAFEQNTLEMMSSMLPRFNAIQENDGRAKIERYMCIMKSMTKEELDSTDPKLMNGSRIMRIARGAGRDVREVVNMLEEYKHMAKMWNNMKGLKIPKRGGRSSAVLPDLSKVLPPQMLNQIGGIGGLQSLINKMGSMN